MRIFLTIAGTWPDVAWWKENQSDADMQSGDIHAFLTNIENDDESNKDIIFLVPGEFTTTYSVLLPNTLPKHKLTQAIPFALEDRLANDIELNHFTLAAETDADGWPVVVTLKENMQVWLAAFAQSSCQLKQVLPDYCAIPCPEDTWHIVEMGDRAVCRMSKDRGFSAPVVLLNTILINKIKTTSITPKKILLTGKTLYSALNPSDFESQKTPILVVNDHPAPLPTLIHEGMQQASSVNLCNGEFRQKDKHGNILKKRVNVFAGLVSACALTACVGLLCQSFYFNRQVTEVDDNIKQLYRKAYPQATSVSSPRARIERDIKALGAGTSDEVFLNLLGAASSELNVNNDDAFKLQQLSYKQNQLQLRFTLESFQSLEYLIEKLKAKGLSVKQDKATSTDSGVNALLTLSLATNQQT